LTQPVAAAFFNTVRLLHHSPRVSERPPRGFFGAGHNRLKQLDLLAGAAAQGAARPARCPADGEFYSAS